jgi:hypothetical protein
VSNSWIFEFINLCILIFYRLLNESKGPILENEMLISTLQSAKETTVTVKDALATAEVTEREIDFTREVSLIPDLLFWERLNK